MALALGVWNVPELLEEMPAELFDWWSRYWQVEPWGELRADQRAAAQALWNTAPYASEATNLPDMQYPYFVDEEEELTKRIKAVEEAKQKWLSQSQNLPST